MPDFEGRTLQEAYRSSSAQYFLFLPSSRCALAIWTVIGLFIVSTEKDYGVLEDVIDVFRWKNKIEITKLDQN